MTGRSRVTLTVFAVVLTIIICGATGPVVAYVPDAARDPAGTPVTNPDGDAADRIEPGSEDQIHSDESGRTRPEMAASDVRYGEAELPAPVRKTREALLAAAATGEIESLREVFAAHGTPIVSFGEVDDAVEQLRVQSGDPEGREILAVLSEVLEAGWVRSQPGSSQETYVWPYFYEVPLAVLTPAQFVELYRILTAVDVEEMERLGAYTFFRVGIRPDGSLRYFIAGD